MRESLFAEMKRYVGFTPADAETLASLAPAIEAHLPALADRFYEQIPKHPAAAAVFAGGEAQIARLKLSLQAWARRLFTGPFDDAYAEERCQIGRRHVQTGVPQQYVIAAMHVVAEFIDEVLDRELANPEALTRARRSLRRIVSVDLNLICDTYFEGSLRQSKALNESLGEANRRLQDASRAKTDFLAAMSHELRTPLTAIIGFSRILVDDYVPDAAEQRRLMVDIHQNALHLLTLVDDVLDVSRIETGRLSIVVEDLDPHVAVAEVVAAFRSDAADKGLNLTVDLGPDLGWIRGDRQRFRQVLLNVLGNAVKFTDRGSITLRGYYDASGDRISLQVRDTGIGVSREHQALLFAKFSQVDSSHTRRRSGLGLGLAISKALVEGMGGALTLDSAGEGAGTVVTIAMPRSTVAGTTEGAS